MWSLEIKALCVAVALWFSAASTPEGGVDVPLAWPDSAACRVEYLGSITSRSDVVRKRSLLSRIVDLAAGPAEKRRTSLVRPLNAAVDPTGRLIVADPGSAGVHILDTARNSHRLLQGPSRLPLRSPVGVDADADGNIYVSDSERGRIFVFDREGRFQRFIGENKNEGFFRRPTGLAIDRSGNLIYLTDTLSHKVYVLTVAGSIVREWGRRGTEMGELNYPLAIALAGDRVFVLDSMNFRVQVFSRGGLPLSVFGRAVNEPGGFFRPKGLGVDPGARRVYVVDAMFEAVQAFTFEGKLVWAFGHGGRAPGEFSLPAGVCVHPDGRVLVADSHNRRIQVFRFRDSQASSDKGSNP